MPEAETHRRRSSLIAHVLLAGLLILAGLAVSRWPGAKPAAWLIVGAAAAIHLGMAIFAFLGIRTLWEAHSGRRSALFGGMTRATEAGAVVEWAAFYDLLTAAVSFGRIGVVREEMLELAGISPGAQVLDVGCGTGSLAIAAKRRVGAEGTVHGVDAGEAMAARARRKASSEGLDVRFDVATAQELPYPDARFDAVLCTLMLHHLPEEGRRRAVEEMRRVLKPGGTLFIADLRPDEGIWAVLLSPIRLLHGHDDLHAARHAEVLMKEAGFGGVRAGRMNLRNLGYVLGRK